MGKTMEVQRMKELLLLWPRSMAVHIIYGLLNKFHKNKHKALKNGINLQSGARLIVKVPRSRVFKLLARFLTVLALTLFLLPWSGIRFIVNDEPALPVYTIKPEVAPEAADPINLESLLLLYNDLNNEGILKPGNKGLLLSDDYDEESIQGNSFLTKTDMEFSSTNDFDRLMLIPDESFDFIFTENIQSALEFIDRSLKVGGIVAVQQLDSSLSFNKPSNYKIVYFRKFNSNLFVMKKVENARPIPSSQRRLLGYNTSEAKRAALKKLEDVLLEPPRASSGTSRTYLKRTKYLPDLLGDSLESYPRRVFIDVGLPKKDGGSATTWFVKNYPTRNLKFEMYKIETLTKDSTKKEVPHTAAETGMSGWLRKNVKEEEYVVMKAEAEVVEDMVKSKAIRLVDELFLECKPKGLGGRKNMSRRAYWECLALYGKLRDEGVAVHQWWG
ncbi:peptide upstream ORF protein [Gossypium australe]|uniref:Peptide upstream ORF protein n=1 Tax=Gossypium australe TaxID=47621 RepID=A0A5B6WSH7_9ROSI|nr:peptide upstream ORF protein [Gossypium australe]